MSNWGKKAYCWVSVALGDSRYWCMNGCLNFRATQMRLAMSITRAWVTQ